MVCKKCNNEFKPIKGLVNFCSMKCRQGKQWTEEDKKKKSIAKNKYNLLNGLSIFEKRCLFCLEKFKPRDNKRIFCSKKCYWLSDLAKENGSIGGKISASLNIKRSKNEIYFYELCSLKYDHVEHNIPMFNNWDADIIIHDLKVAILWNGKWHYEKITKSHSIEQVQNRDKIKRSEIQKLNWTVYEIKDMGRFNKTFVEDQYSVFVQRFSTSIS